MSAFPVLPNLLRILPDPSRPPSLTPIERIAVALERIADRFDKDARELEEMIANGGSLAVEAAADAVKRDAQRLSKAMITRQSKETP
jgi:hypothetical protein